MVGKAPWTPVPPSPSWIWHVGSLANSFLILHPHHLACSHRPLPFLRPIVCSTVTELCVLAGAASRPSSKALHDQSKAKAELPNGYRAGRVIRLGNIVMRCFWRRKSELKAKHNALKDGSMPLLRTSVQQYTLQPDAHTLASSWLWLAAWRSDDCPARLRANHLSTRISRNKTKTPLTPTKVEFSSKVKSDKGFD